MTEKVTKRSYAANQARIKMIALGLAGFIVLSVSFVGTYNYGASSAARAVKTSSGVAANTMGFNPSTGRAAPGEAVSVTMYANSGTRPVNAVQARIVYDDSRLELQNIEETGELPQIAATDKATPGIIQIARASGTAPVTGNVAVVKLVFVVKPGVSGGASVSIDNLSSYIVSSETSENIMTGSSTSTFNIRR